MKRGKPDFYFAAFMLKLVPSAVLVTLRSHEPVHVKPDVLPTEGEEVRKAHRATREDAFSPQNDNVAR